MILTTTRHGRTRRDCRHLLAHLSSEKGQRSCVIEVAAPVRTADEALEYMQALRDGSRASVAFHHLSLSPSAPLSDRQRDEAVRRVLAAMEAEDHAFVVWEHSGKHRRKRDVDTHYHIVVAHVGPDGRALDDGRSYVRLEAAARALECDFGHDLTAGRRTSAVAAELERQGRRDVAARLRGETPPEPPRSAMSSRQRARAERLGASLPDVRVTVRQAWQASDSAGALRAALAEAGLGIARGDKPGVWIVTGSDGATLGALDRLAGQRRRAVQERMQRQETPTHAEPDTATRHARPARDLRPGAREPGGGRGATAAAVPPRPDAARRRDGAGRGDGAAVDHCPDAAGNPAGHRGPVRQAGRGELATVGAMPSPGPRRFGIRKIAPRSRARSAIDARRLARIDLDEILRLAEEAGRRAALLVARMVQGRDEAAALRARIRAVSGSPSTKRRAGKPIQRDSRVAPTWDPSEIETFIGPRR